MSFNSTWLSCLDASSSSRKCIRNHLDLSWSHADQQAARTSSRSCWGSPKWRPHRLGRCGSRHHHSGVWGGVPKIHQPHEDYPWRSHGWMRFGATLCPRRWIKNIRLMNLLLLPYSRRLCAGRPNQRTPRSWKKPAKMRNPRLRDASPRRRRALRARARNIVEKLSTYMWCESVRFIEIDWLSAGFAKELKKQLSCEHLKTMTLNNFLNWFLNLAWDFVNIFRQKPWEIIRDRRKASESGAEVWSKLRRSFDSKFGRSFKRCRSLSWYNVNKTLPYVLKSVS